MQEEWSRRKESVSLTLKGGADQDFGEWTRKVFTFMHARFGDQIVTALTWAARQRKIVVKTCVASQRERIVSWITVFGEGADQEDGIDEMDDFVGKLYAYLVSFTTDAANSVVSELRIRELHWRIGCQRNVDTSCSPTGTDGPARHQMTALWRPCSG